MLIDERRKLKVEMRDKMSQIELRENEFKYEIARLREELALLSKGDELRGEILEENQALKDQIVEFRASIQQL